MRFTRAQKMVKLATLFLISFNNGAAAGCGDAQWIHKTAILGQLLVVSYRDGNDLRLLIHLPGSKYCEWLTIYVFFVSVNCVSSSSYGRFIKLNLEL